MWNVIMGISENSDHKASKSVTPISLNPIIDRIRTGGEARLINLALRRSPVANKCTRTDSGDPLEYGGKILRWGKAELIRNLFNVSILCRE